MKTQRGSALLITMIVITVIGTIAFAIGASTISSFRRQTQLEDSLNAYQAAVAGLEDGLLRWRYNKDTETPIFRLPPLDPIKESGELNCPALRPHTTTAYYDRVNLSTGHVTYCIDPGTVPPPDPSEIVYDIKIHYKKGPNEPEQVSPPPTSSGFVPAIAKDDVVEYDVSELPPAGVGNIDLTWIFKNFSGDLTQRLEIFALDGNGEIVPNSRYLTTLDDNRRANMNIPTQYPLRGGVKIRIRPYGEDVKSYTIEDNNPSVSIDSRITNIEVVGYFGSAKRKLKLALDRTSGSLLPIYDHVLFSEGSGIGS